VIEMLRQASETAIQT